MQRVVDILTQNGVAAIVGVRGLLVSTAGVLLAVLFHGRSKVTTAIAME